MVLIFSEQPEAELSACPDSAGLPLHFPEGWGAPILRSGHWRVAWSTKGASPTGSRLRQNQNQLPELSWAVIKIIMEPGYRLGLPHSWETQH